MSDGSAPKDGFDLCIVGAGISGLNALFVASKYLPRKARVALIDSHTRCGGMWNDAYKFVRLHQPYRMFTVGNMRWTLDKPNDYLATRDEVLNHLEHCLALLRTRFDVTEFYQHTLEKIDEPAPRPGEAAGVHCLIRDEKGRSIDILAKRLIDSRAFDIATQKPLEAQSRQVRTSSPANFDPRASKAPVFIVGGGKTGMDTALHVIRSSPGRTVNLIVGPGTLFARREYYAPSGTVRWWQGDLISNNFRDLAMRYDGTNGDEVFEYFRRKFTVSPQGGAEQFLFGLMSESESDEIASGTNEVIHDYFVDAVDTDSGPQLVFRTGKPLLVEPGSEIVNCCGHIYRQAKPYEPYLSASQRILRINTRSTVHFLSTVSAYFLTHLFFLGRLAQAELVALDSETLFHKNRKDWQFASITLSYMNLVSLINALPFRALDECGLDLDRWFPMHRRVASLLNTKINARRYLEHCRATMDTIQRRHGLIAQPLRIPTLLPPDSASLTA